MTGSDNVKSGNGGEVTGDNNVVLGKGASAKGDDGIAIGTGALTNGTGVALGANSKATDGNVALGQGVNAESRTGTHVVAVGDRVITGVHAGTEDTDAVNLGQLKAVKSAATRPISIAAEATGHGSVSGEAFELSPGDALSLKAGDNIALTLDKTGKSAQFALKNNLIVERVTTGTNVLSADGLEVKKNGEQVVMTNSGLNYTVNSKSSGIHFAETAGVVDLLIGQNANTTVDESNPTSLGHNVFTSEFVPMDNASSLAINKDNIGGKESKHGVVCFGSKESATRLMNVAAGLIAKGSTDAINGSQLFETARAVRKLEDGFLEGWSRRE